MARVSVSLDSAFLPVLTVRSGEKIKKINVCLSFFHWFSKRFKNKKPQLQEVWKAIKVPNWLLYAATTEKLFGWRCCDIAYQISDSFCQAGIEIDMCGFQRGPSECDLIRLALPGELMEALFIETCQATES